MTTLLRSGALVLLVACSSDSEGDGPGNSEGAPIIERFEIEPGGRGTEGGDVTLTWSVTGAKNIQIDPGVGSIDGSEVAVTIRETTLFTLTATNDQGSTEASTVGLVASAGPPLIDRSARTAADQIEDALALGEIDEVTALRYKVFALHGDERLPAEFDADGPVHGSPIMLELAQRFEELPMEVQEELQPFRLPPDDPGSWYAARKFGEKGGSAGLFDEPLLVADSRVAIRSDASFSDAQKLYARIVVGQAATRSYRALSELMGRSPIGNGADPDVYKVFVLSNSSRSDLGWATATSVPSGGSGWRSHVTINLDAILADVSDSEELLASDLTSATVAHELFHAIQYANDIEEESASSTWLEESTATWAEHFVYPLLNTEQVYSASFFSRSFISLDDLRETHEYGGYLFHLYVTERLGDPKLMRAFWEATERLPVFSAINEVLDDQLVELFSEVVFNKLVFSREPTPIEELVEGSSSTTTLGNYVFAAFLNPSYRFELTDGEVEWTVAYSYSDPGQSCQGEGSITLDETLLFGTLQTFNHFLPNDPNYRSYYLEVSPVANLTYDVTCDVSGGGQRTKRFSLSNFSEGPFRIADDGLSILDFTESMTDGGIATYLELWSWELLGAPLESPP